MLPENEQKEIRTEDGSLVKLLDIMGSDSEIVRSARTSYGKDLEERSKADDVTLLHYLLRHRHTTPFEMGEVKFLLEMPIDTMRQHVRHRTFSINEYSTRYTEAIDKTAEVGDRGWRLQSSSNKQGSSDAVVTEWPDGWVFQKTQSGSGTPPNDWELWDLTGEHAVLVCAELPEGLTPGQYLSLRESDIQAESRLTYEERLKFGVAKEVARKDLVLCTFTRLYWKGNLHNFMHYLGLRREGHAQKEIRDIADAMYELVLPYFPEALNAWNEWRFMGASFGACEMAAIKAMLADVSDLLPEYKWLTEQLCEHYSTTWTKIHGTAATKRQIAEFRDKLGL